MEFLIHFVGNFPIELFNQATFESSYPEYFIKQTPFRLQQLNSSTLKMEEIKDIPPDPSVEDSSDTGMKLIKWTEGVGDPMGIDPRNL